MQLVPAIAAEAMAIGSICSQCFFVCCTLLMLGLASSQPSDMPREIGALSAAIDGFGTSIVTQQPNSTATNGNVISPASISLALGLLLAGATPGTPAYG